MKLKRSITYNEYENILRQHNAINRLHSSKQINSLLISSIQPILDQSRFAINELMEKHHISLNSYDFNDLNYYNKVESHLSLLTGYYSLLMMYSQYSYLHRMRVFSQVSSSIGEIKRSLEKSNSEIENVPLIKKTMTSISLKFQKEASPIKSDPSNQELVQKEDTCSKESTSDSVALETLSKAEIKVFVKQRCTSVKPIVIKDPDEISLDLRNSFNSNISMDGDIITDKPDSERLESIGSLNLTLRLNNQGFLVGEE